MKPSPSHLQRFDTVRRPIADAVLMASAAVLLLVLLEWLFFVTKPSMFSVMGWPQRLAVLASSALPVLLLAAGLAAGLTLAARLRPGARDRAAAGSAVGLVVPALLLTAAALLLVENFTVTVAGFNLGSLESALRYLYAVGLGVALVLFHRWLCRLVSGDRFRRARRGALLALLLLAAGLTAVAAWRYLPLRAATAGAGATGATERPSINVLIFSSDGMNANRLSVYGAERETTPFLDRRVDEFLVSENHISNSAGTAGSTGALLTGKLPTTTGVTQQFRVFQGRDVYEHLPGILRRLGYYGIEIGARHYADSHDQNLRHGFHLSNGRRLAADDLAPLRWYGRHYPSERHFVASVGERVRERVAHSFGLADMAGPILAPTERQPKWTSDELRVEALRREIERAPRPFFAHVHLLDTHGPRFRVRERRYSPAEPQKDDWDFDYLDDAILGFDRFVEEVVGFLESIGELDNTLLIINTDHGSRYDRSQRLPLLMRFPGAEPSGRLRATSQRIDLAPTILDYLGVEVPEWMEGESLLGDGVGRRRVLFTAGWSEHEANIPVALVQCQQWLELEPRTGQMRRTALAGHTDPCDEAELLGEEESRAAILALLVDSPHFVEPMLIASKLYQLRTSRDPGLRAEVLRGFRQRVERVRYLDDEMAVAWSHWDFWTYGTAPAGLVVTNRGDEPLVRRLQVHSAKNREFPFAFHVEDGEERHDFTFERPGAVTVELAPVAPGGERLFVVWSDTAREGADRMIGVKLALAFSDQLEKLVRRPDAEERRRLASLVLEDAAERGWLDHDLRLANAYWDHWSRGSQPVALVARNPGRQPTTPRVEVRSGSGRDFPLRFQVEDGEATREYVFDRPGAMTVELAPVEAGSARLFILWTDRPWRPEGGDRRHLGIRLAAPR